MDLTAQRRFLTASTAGFIALAVTVVVWSLGGVDSDDRQSDILSDRAPMAKASVGPSQKDPRTNQDGSTDLSLRVIRPLYDPPAPPPKPEPKPVVVRKQPAPPKKANLDWTLNGTIIDSDRSVAILTDASGKTDIRRAGEKVELSPPGVLVRRIDSDRVTLELRGSESTLRLQQSFQSGGGADTDRSNRRRNR